VLERIRVAHFIGVGGSGMSPLAEVLLRRGVRVSGSDEKATTVTAQLQTLGLEFHQGHDPSHVGDVDVVVRSSAVRPSNPEVVEAQRRSIPVILRGELLALLMAGKTGIAIAGAHGKTTTTSMAGLMLDRAGLDPTVVIGGRLAQFGSSARVGGGAMLVAEADESDRSFLLLSPVYVAVTNIDREHLESYADLADLEQAFASFVGRVPAAGAAVLCVDDPALRRIAATTPARVVRYGLDHPTASISAVDIVSEGFGGRAIVVRRTENGGHERLGEIVLQVPGRHNLANALAVVALGLELGVPFAVIAAALAEFRGAERRFERKGEARGITVVDDYGHHPTEIAAVLGAARATGARRVVCVFQPHRYSRTAHLLADFGPALAMADAVVLTDIYSAGEDPQPGITVDAVADEVRKAGGRVEVVRDLADVPVAVARIAQAGDLVLTMGAGSVGGLGPKVVEAIESCR
jgi:UDP-N-acetylmuramate--alanine ligase